MPSSAVSTRAARHASLYGLIHSGNADNIWGPHADNLPQRMAFDSDADELFYGGAAGGGKTDVIIGTSIRKHKRSIIFRREYPNLDYILDRTTELLIDHAKWNGQRRRWTYPDGRIMQLGAMQYEADKFKYQGRPYDFYGFDEITEFTETQFQFVTNWLRSTADGQRCRVLCAGNPPATPEGEWVKKYWGAWIDENNPNPAEPGELRWYAIIDDEDVEVQDGEAIEHNDETIYPRSRTFIPALLSDNPYYGAEYRGVLQRLPEPLRSMYLDGRFDIAPEDDIWQVIPSAWIKLAQERWKDTPQPESPVTAIGLDAARGGKAENVLARRRGWYCEQLRKCPGKDTKDGGELAAWVMVNYSDDQPVLNCDSLGIGTSPYDILKDQHLVNGQRLPVNGVNFAKASKKRDRSRKYKLRNLRAEAYWGFRELLDPIHGEDIALPPDSNLAADLAAPRWKLTTGGILIEDKEQVAERLGRSPDAGDAVVLAYLYGVYIQAFQGRYEQGL